MSPPACGSVCRGGKGRDKPVPCGVLRPRLVGAGLVPARLRFPHCLATGNTARDKPVAHAFLRRRPLLRVQETRPELDAPVSVDTGGDPERVEAVVDRPVGATSVVAQGQMYLVGAGVDYVETGEDGVMPALVP